VSNVSAAYSGANPASPPASNLAIGAGFYVVNLLTAMTDANFAISGACNQDGGLTLNDGDNIFGGFAYNEKCIFITTVRSANTGYDCLHNSVQVIR
jgi:hypothetical protein